MFNTLLVQPIFNILALLYAIIPGHDFGIAIILLTILVRIALWPALKKQLHSQRAMQKLAPDIAKIKEKTKGDKQAESTALMELYKERGINPLASLVPVLVQLPLFLALYAVLRDIIKPGEIAHLVYGPLKDLATIKGVIAGSIAFKPTLLGLIDLTKPSILLAVAAGLVQFVQTRQLAPAKNTDDAQAATFAGMSILFPLLTVFIGWRLAAALSLYWTVTSLVAVIQQWIVLRQDVEEMEETGEKKRAK
jgi:YidC/Oxa1 family membrane protein insertase